MNPYLANLHLYPFERLNALLNDRQAPDEKQAIALSLGEPKHQPPVFLSETLSANLQGLTKYPTTRGLPVLSAAIADWLAERYKLPRDLVCPEKNVLPVSGTREALFSIAHCIVKPGEGALVLMPNPFYQIYEGAAILAGAEPYYLNPADANSGEPDFDSVPDSVWKRCQLLYICTPGNPTGAVLLESTLQNLIRLAERYGFVIASDECYSELYLDESNPPCGLLQAAYSMGNENFEHCLVFQSLSKRSNAPGLRSGFVAGDSDIIQAYYRYRTYHGCTIPLYAQHASLHAWQDEAHVLENRTRYREKFSAVLEILGNCMDVTLPGAGFFLWPKTPFGDTEFTARLFAQQNVKVLPGSYLSRPFNGVNPGRNRVRIALVAPLDECVEAAQRIKTFTTSL